MSRGRPRSVDHDQVRDFFNKRQDEIIGIDKVIAGLEEEKAALQNQINHGFIASYFNVSISSIDRILHKRDMSVYRK